MDNNKEHEMIIYEKKLFGKLINFSVNKYGYSRYFNVDITHDKPCIGFSRSDYTEYTPEDVVKIANKLLEMANNLIEDHRK